MTVIALVIACLGPMCSYTATTEPFDSVRQCQVVAPMIAGIERSRMTSSLWLPADIRRTTSFRCIDPATGEVLAAYNSEEQVAALNSRPGGR
ncbi:MAG: hypothetical protein AB1918_12820 [Pseudomonadota bacterium]